MLFRRDSEPEETSVKHDRLTTARATFGIAFGLAVAGVIFNAVLYHRHSTRDARLAEHGQRVPAAQTGKASRVDARMGRDFWRIRYSYEAGGRTYNGSARMYFIPASLSVVFDPDNPVTHRLVGSLNPTREDQRTLIAFLITAAIFGVIVLRVRKLPDAE
jgi:hypothetical protein